jgi:hypothetical protein
VAWNDRIPAVLTVKGKPVASTVPSAASAIGPELFAAVPAQVPLRNQLIETLPVAAG